MRSRLRLQNDDHDRAVSSQRLGFTMIELLVGAAIAVVILTALLLLLQSVGSVRESQSEGAESDEALRLVHTELAAQLRYITVGGTNACELLAAPGHLAFCSLFPSDIGGLSEQVEVEVKLEDDELRQVVTRRKNGAFTNVLLDAVSAFSVDAFVEGEWGAIGEGIPNMLRVHIELEDGTAQAGTVVIPASLEVMSGLERR